MNKEELKNYFNKKELALAVFYCEKNKLATLEDCKNFVKKKINNLLTESEVKETLKDSIREDLLCSLEDNPFKKYFKRFIDTIVIEYLKSFDINQNYNDASSNSKL